MKRSHAAASGIGFNGFKVAWEVIGDIKVGPLQKLWTPSALFSEMAPLGSLTVLLDGGHVSVAKCVLYRAPRQRSCVSQGLRGTVGVISTDTLGKGCSLSVLEGSTITIGSRVLAWAELLARSSVHKVRKPLPRLLIFPQAYIRGLVSAQRPACWEP